MGQRKQTIPMVEDRPAVLLRSLGRHTYRWIAGTFTGPTRNHQMLFTVVLTLGIASIFNHPAPPVVQYFGDLPGAPAFPSIVEGGEVPKPAPELLVAGVEIGGAQAYIERYAPLAVIEMRKFGVPASISLAQGLVESKAGASKLARDCNNHFGIKCFSKKCKAGHCVNYQDDTHKDFFRNFGTVWESWRAHSTMLSTGRYQRLHKYGKDYRKWAQGLKDLGYATDDAYRSKLISLIERYHLNRFDK